MSQQQEETHSRCYFRREQQVQSPEVFLKNTKIPTRPGPLMRWGGVQGQVT
jgi:hypothetical protein